MTRTLALSSILSAALIAGACAGNTTPEASDTSMVLAPKSLALSSVNCQWWYRNSDPEPLPLRERFIKCEIGGQTIRFDSSGVGQNGGE
jgi:hypothetical protein